MSRSPLQQHRTWFVVVGSLGLLLAIALLANLWLLQRTRHYARLFHIARLDPLNIGAHPTMLPADQTRSSPAVRRVVLFGDSRARQWTTPPQNEQYVFFNRGADGQTSAQALYRFSYHVPPLKPDIVVIQVGANDLMAVSLLRGDREEIIADCQANIVAIVEQSRAAGARVVLTTIFPLGGLPFEQQLLGVAAVPAAITEVNAFIRGLAADDLIVFDAATLLSDADGRLPAEYQADFLHVNARAYALLNNELLQILPPQE